MDSIHYYQMDAASRQKITTTLSSYVTNAILLYIALVLAFLSSKLIHLPAHNPFNISNQFVATGFSPEVNFVRIIWMITAGVLIYLGLVKLQKARRTLFRILIALIVAGGVFGAYIMPTVNSKIGNLDTFHNGEQLSPAKAFENGTPLFTGMFVLHGAGEDVLVPAVAFHIPGTPADGGIGSYLFLTSTLQLVSALVFMLMLARLLRSTALYLVAAFWFVFSAYSGFFNARDIVIWTLIILLWYIFESNLTGRFRLSLLAFIGLLASASLMYSIDRGYIALFIASCSAGALLLTETIDEGSRRKLSLPLKLNRWYEPLAIGIGIVIAQLSFAGLMGLHQYGEFIRTTFSSIPKYQGLLFNYPLPNTTAASFLLWLPILVAMLGLLMLGYVLIREFRHNIFNGETLLLLVMFLTSVLFLRAGYGRSDSYHIAYSTPLLFVTLLVLASVVWSRGIKRDTSILWMPLIFMALLFFPVNPVNPTSLTAFPSISLGVIKDYAHLPSRSDRYWLPENVAQAADYIKKNTNQNDSIFVFTQQPIYYYLTNRRNPTRFYIPWFADPQPLTTEMLKALKADQPKLILYNSGSSWDQPDGYTMKDIAPEVDAWIKANYTQEVNIGTVTLLIR